MEIEIESKFRSNKEKDEAAPLTLLSFVSFIYFYSSEWHY